MEFKRSCPYYGQSEDRCDVGFGYISPHDVEVIVRHCISRYEDCERYAELSAPCGEGRGPLSALSLGASDLPSGSELRELASGLSIDREALTSIHHELRTPLTSIRSFTEILLQYPIEDLDAKKKFLRIIHEEAERLHRTVEAWFGTPDGDAETPSARTAEWQERQGRADL